jgi:hypothetical protein
MIKKPTWADIQEQEELEALIGQQTANKALPPVIKPSVEPKKSRRSKKNEKKKESRNGK